MEVASGHGKLLTGARDTCLVTSNFVNGLEDFSALANFWLFADSLQSRNVTEVVMREFELTAEEIELLEAGIFNLVGPGEEPILLRHAPRHDGCPARSIRGFRGSRVLEERLAGCGRIEVNDDSNGTQVSADGVVWRSGHP